MLYKYKGYLYMYSEQGIGPHPILQDFRGTYKENGWSLSFAYFFNKKKVHKASIWNKEGELVFKGNLTFKPDNRYYQIAPIEIPKEDWYEMLNNNYIMELETNGTILMNESEIELSPRSNFNVYRYGEKKKEWVFKGDVIGNIKMNSILKLRFKEKNEEFYKKFYTLSGYVISFKTTKDGYIISTSDNEIYHLIKA